MSWFVLQSNSADTNGTSIPCQFTSDLSSGTKLIAYVSSDIGSGGVTTGVNDGNGNSFTKIAGTTHGGSGSGETTVWVLDTPAGDVETAPTITATFSQSVDPSILIQEVSGLAPGTVIDGTPGTLNGSSYGGVGPPTYASSASGEYLVYVYGDDGYTAGNTWTAPAGYTPDPANISGTNNSDVGVAYKSSTDGTETGQYETNGYQDWALILFAFKLAATSTGLLMAGIV